MIAAKILTFFKGRMIGQDQFGNSYYEEKFLFFESNKRRPRRWVIYNGIEEASKVTSDWHGWLHFTTNIAPENIHYAWQKPHLPNVTATKRVYLPSNHILKGGKMEAKHYEAWSPNK